MNIPCTTCGGSGKWLRLLPDGNWGIFRTPENCPTCLGSGTIWVMTPFFQPLPSAPMVPMPMIGPIRFTDSTSLGYFDPSAPTRVMC